VISMSVRDDSTLRVGCGGFKTVVTFFVVVLNVVF
jgi:hypothetical protein